MRSLVVLCAVVFVTAAVPHPGLIKKSVQAVANNAPAVSHQSRFDVKTSQVVPASIAAEAVASLQARALAPFNNPSSVSQKSYVVPGSVSPVVPAPLAAHPVYTGQVPTLSAGGSAVVHEFRYDTASGPYVGSGQFLQSVQGQPVQPVISPW
ncbi:hypothetical protein O3G_MSEX002231 [Manduca sexta]|uniref:Cuticle protein n=1 Tax=Manduca sexta TaxID=7130 RepID=A0A922CDH6_MANSE|nr:hypothetical protein O3G_MSEX002231 [Manduca sexta]KAG6442253.1 hypothetical protein O3G_MSEX002231 [Manduca sexta]